MAEINQPNGQNISPKKRVLFIVTQSEWGGAQRFLYNLVSALNRQDYDLSAAAGDSTLNVREESSLLNAFKQIDIPVRRLRFLKRAINPFYDIKAVSELRTLLNALKPDILFLNSSKAGIIGSLAAKQFPEIKVIYRIGGWSFNDPLPWLVRKFYIFAERYTAKFKDFIVVNSKHDFDQAKRLKIKPRQGLELIYNGIDPYWLEFFEKNEAKVKLASLLRQRQKNLLQAGFVIGTIANFYKNKGLKYLIRAAKILYSKYNLPETVFVVIGEGTERQNLELEIQNAGLVNRILLTGAIPDAHKYLLAFDIFVLPSLKEGFPWVLLEAMSAKLPVIATRVGANPEIIEDKTNGFLVKPGKPEEIASALKLLLDSDGMRQEFGIQAHQTVLRKFDQNKMLEKVKALLN